MAHKRTLLACFDSSEAQDFDWDDFVDDVRTQVMARLKTDKFFAYGLSLTWRNVAGYTRFETDSARTLLFKVLPDTSDIRVEVYTTPRRGVVDVIAYHHDKPTGETLHLMSQATAKRLKVMEEHFA